MNLIEISNCIRMENILARYVELRSIIKILMNFSRCNYNATQHRIISNDVGRIVNGLRKKFIKLKIKYSQFQYKNNQLNRLLVQHIPMHIYESLHFSVLRFY